MRVPPRSRFAFLEFGQRGPAASATRPLESSGTMLPGRSLCLARLAHLAPSRRSGGEGADNQQVVTRHRSLAMAKTPDRKIISLRARCRLARGTAMAPIHLY